MKIIMANAEQTEFLTELKKDLVTKADLEKFKGEFQPGSATEKKITTLQEVLDHHCDDPENCPIDQKFQAEQYDGWLRGMVLGLKAR